MRAWMWSGVFVLSCGSPEPEPSEPSAPITTGSTTGSGTSTPSTGTRDTGDSCGDLETPSSTSADHSHAALSHDPERTGDNALKGFLTSYSWGEPASKMPDQLEFAYLPMRELWDESGATLETGLEPELVAAAARGHHLILRVFIDYPAGNSGLPEHLVDTVSCEPYTEYGGGCSPDYSDPALLEAMLGLIAALGEAYDGDPRLGFVQVGLLGFWGEWHTYPHTDWFPDEEIQDAVLEAYTEAFLTTALQVRRPAASSLERRIGFHDDSFAYSTIGDIGWFFWPKLVSAGGEDRWQEVSIGGELRPELQAEVFSADYQAGKYAQDMDECIDQTHVSYLLNYTAFSGSGTGYLGEELERAQQAALRMGYEFHLSAATLSASALLDGELSLSLSLEISQTGVAPFYYPLELVVHSPLLSEAITSPVDLHTLLPDQTRELSIDLGRVPASLLSETLELGLGSPMLLDGQVIRFATTSPQPTTTGDLGLRWDVSCQTDSGPVEVGAVAGRDASGCDCSCDVDGQLRGPDGAVCP